jgi:hypothetical protein
VPTYANSPVVQKAWKRTGLPDSACALGAGAAAALRLLPFSPENLGTIREPTRRQWENANRPRHPRNPEEQSFAPLLSVSVFMGKWRGGIRKGRHYAGGCGRCPVVVRQRKI